MLSRIALLSRAISGTRGTSARFFCDKVVGPLGPGAEAFRGVKEVSAEPLIIPNDDEELQAHWRSMESRIKRRKTKTTGPRGRTGLRPSAWDHENV
jgi:hypothetical protein